MCCEPSCDAAGRGQKNNRHVRTKCCFYFPLFLFSFPLFLFWFVPSFLFFQAEACASQARRSSVALEVAGVSQPSGPKKLSFTTSNNSAWLRLGITRGKCSVRPTAVASRVTYSLASSVVAASLWSVFVVFLGGSWHLFFFLCLV